jgi:diaminopimelate decarboxylase
MDVRPFSAPTTVTDPFWDCVADASDRYGTPIYLYFPQQARLAYQTLYKALAHWGYGRIAFSVKTNPLYALLNGMREWGSYAEVVSAWEFALARAAGFPPGCIVYNGPLKTDEELKAIVGSPPLTVNLDSLDELLRLEVAVRRSIVPLGVGVRLCPPHPNFPASRFGMEISTGEVAEALGRIAAHPNMFLASVHFHLGTQIQDLSTYTTMLAVTKELWYRHRLGPEVWLDIGGGFCYDHAVRFDQQAFEPARFVRALAEDWDEPRPPLLMEPGRFIAAPAMAVVSRVLSCKPRTGEPTVVVLDSGTNHNIMGAFYEHLWEFPANGSEPGEYRFCGPLCMEDDVLSGARSGPCPRTGDLVVMHNAGAYSFALSRCFIQPRPPILQLNDDGTTTVLQSRETLAGAYGLAATCKPALIACGAKP